MTHEHHAAGVDLLGVLGPLVAVLALVAYGALVVRGGWEGHRPVEATERFLPFLRSQGFAVRVEESTAVYADARAMAETDLVVQCVSMSEIAPGELAGLRSAVEAGTGLTGWHGGIVDSFRSSSDYLQLVGGQFATHPANFLDVT